MELLCLILVFFVGYQGGKYFGYKEGAEAYQLPFQQKMKEAQEMISGVREMQEQAENMKIAFLEKIHQKLEVKVLIKDHNGVVVETVEMK